MQTLETLRCKPLPRYVGYLIQCTNLPALLKSPHARHTLVEDEQRIGPTVKCVWNYSMHMLCIFGGFVINTTAYQLGQFSLHIQLHALCYRVTH